MCEVWKDVVGFEGLYQVSNFGRVKSLAKKAGKSSRDERIKTPIICCSGYAKVNTCKNNDQKQISIHRLVAEAFIPNPENKPCVNHIDGNKLNNHVDNLEWCTQKENVQHAIEHGLRTHSHHSPTIIHDKDSNETIAFETQKSACEFLHRNPKFISQKIRKLHCKRFEYGDYIVEVVT